MTLILDQLSLSLALASNVSTAIVLSLSVCCVLLAILFSTEQLIINIFIENVF